MPTLSLRNLSKSALLESALHAGKYLSKRYILLLIRQLIDCVEIEMFGKCSKTPSWMKRNMLLAIHARIHLG